MNKSLPARPKPLSVPRPPPAAAASHARSSSLQELLQIYGSRPQVVQDVSAVLLHPGFYADFQAGDALALNYVRHRLPLLVNMALGEFCSLSVPESGEDSVGSPVVTPTAAGTSAASAVRFDAAPPLHSTKAGSSTNSGTSNDRRGAAMNAQHMALREVAVRLLCGQTPAERLHHMATHIAEGHSQWEYELMRQFAESRFVLMEKMCTALDLACDQLESIVPLAMQTYCGPACCSAPPPPTAASMWANHGSNTTAAASSSACGLTSANTATASTCAMTGAMERETSTAGVDLPPLAQLAEVVAAHSATIRNVLLLLEGLLVRVARQNHHRLSSPTLANSEAAKYGILSAPCGSNGALDVSPINWPLPAKGNSGSLPTSLPSSPFTFDEANSPNGVDAVGRGARTMSGGVAAATRSFARNGAVGLAATAPATGAAAAVGGSECAEIEADALHIVVHRAIRAFTHVFLSITAVQQQLTHYAECHKLHHCNPTDASRRTFVATAGQAQETNNNNNSNNNNYRGDAAAMASSAMPQDESEAGCADHGPDCEQCRTYHTIEREMTRQVEQSMELLKLTTVAIAAHDSAIAEIAIEYIDAKGPIFTAQATMLLAHVLTPELLAQHPTGSRGGQALQWILSFVFGGCDGSDVERTQRQRRTRLMQRRSSDCFSLNNSSMTESDMDRPSASPAFLLPQQQQQQLSAGHDEERGGHGAGGPLSRARMQQRGGNGLARGYGDEAGALHGGGDRDEADATSPTATRLSVEYILAAAFTRCHPLMTVIGYIAESNAYECGLTVAKAVMQYAFTLSQTSARFMREPQLGSTWITPFTTAMMRGLSDLANMKTSPAALAAVVATAATTTTSGVTAVAAYPPAVPSYMHPPHPLPTSASTGGSNHHNNNNNAAAPLPLPHTAHPPLPLPAATTLAGGNVSATSMTSVPSASFGAHDEHHNAGTPTRARFPFQPRPNPLVTGTSVLDKMETARGRTHRRALSLRWAKCIVLSARTLAKAGITQVPVPRDHYGYLNELSKRLQTLLTAFANEMHPEAPPCKAHGASQGAGGNGGVMRRSGSESASEEPSAAAGRVMRARTSSVCLMSTRNHSEVEMFTEAPRQLLLPKCVSQPWLGHDTPSERELKGQRRYETAFMDSFCLGKSVVDLLTETPYITLPMHEVIFASLFSIFEAISDVLLCEQPHLNAIFANELITLLYEVHQGMLKPMFDEPQPATHATPSAASPPLAVDNDEADDAAAQGTAAGQTHSHGAAEREEEEERHAGRMASVETAAIASSSVVSQASPELLFVDEYGVLLSNGLRCGEVLERWERRLGEDAGDPCAGYAPLLRDLYDKIAQPPCLYYTQRPSYHDYACSARTLRLLLGVSVREGAAAMHGNVLHVDDLDVEGTKKEDVALRLGVTASRDSPVPSDDDEHVAHNTSLGEDEKDEEDKHHRGEAARYDAERHTRSTLHEPRRHRDVYAADTAYDDEAAAMSADAKKSDDAEGDSAAAAAAKTAPQPHAPRNSREQQQQQQQQSEAALPLQPSHLLTVVGTEAEMAVILARALPTWELASAYHPPDAVGAAANSEDEAGQTSCARPAVSRRSPLRWLHVPLHVPSSRLTRGRRATCAVAREAAQDAPGVVKPCDKAARPGAGGAACGGAYEVEALRLEGVEDDVGWCSPGELSPCDQTQTTDERSNSGMTPTLCSDGNLTLTAVMLQAQAAASVASSGATHLNSLFENVSSTDCSSSMTSPSLLSSSEAGDEEEPARVTIA